MAKSKNYADVKIADEARKAGVSPAIVYNRLHSGWPLEKALAVKPRLRKAPKKRKPSVVVPPAPAPAPTTVAKQPAKKSSSNVSETIALMLMSAVAGAAITASYVHYLAQ